MYDDELYICDLCEMEILPFERFYEMPDGFTVCAECLRDWEQQYEH